MARALCTLRVQEQKLSRLCMSLNLSIGNQTFLWLCYQRVTTKVAHNLKYDLDLKVTCLIPWIRMFIVDKLWIGSSFVISRITIKLWACMYTYVCFIGMTAVNEQEKWNFLKSFHLILCHFCRSPAFTEGSGSWFLLWSLWDILTECFPIYSTHFKKLWLGYTHCCRGSYVLYGMSKIGLKVMVMNHNVCKQMFDSSLFCFFVTPEQRQPKKEPW